MLGQENTHKAHTKKKAIESKTRDIHDSDLSQSLNRVLCEVLGGFTMMKNDRDSNRRQP